MKIGYPLMSLNEVRPHQHLAFIFLVYKTEREQICTVYNAPKCVVICLNSS